MPEEFEVSHTQAGPRVVVLRVQGHLNARSTPLLVQKAREIKDKGMHIVLNLGEVVFIASSGIGGLLALVEDFREAGLTVRLADLSSPVLSVIKLLNLDQFLAIDLDEHQALAALES